MTRSYSLPFKTLLGTELTLGRWHYRIGTGDWQHADPGVRGWDYLSELGFYRDITVDGAKARSACDLESTTPVELIVTVHCPAARFRRVLFRATVPEEVWTGSATFTVPSREIAESLNLETELILMQARGSGSRFSAQFQGSRLFSDGVDIDIEGARSRMPMESVSFSKHLGRLEAPRAPWYVECGAGDLHAPVMRELRVYLNSDQPAFAEAAQRDSTILVLLKADIARQLLETALEDEDFRQGATDYGEGTLGETALRTLKLCFPHARPADVLSLARRDASRFQAMILSRYNNPP